jgi:FkbM family methyltransferase
MWTRPATNDIDEIHQTFRHYRHMPQLSGVALDLGAHIGASAQLMRNKGAEMVVAVEADPANAALLMLNSDEHTHVINVAVTAAGGWAMLSRNQHGHTTTHYTQFSSAQRSPLPVPAIPYWVLYEHVRPSVLKVDIEYGEWDFWEDLWNLPHTNVIQIEFHFNHFKDEGTKYRQIARELGESWTKQGFECLRGHVTPQAWYSEQLWVRHGH